MTKQPTRFGRRLLLGGVAAGAALRLLPRSTADAQGRAPRRLIVIFTSNGTVRDAWLPTMRGGALELSTILQPLERHKSRLLVVDGVDYRVVREKGERHTGHHGGMLTALTGAPGVVPSASEIDFERRGEEGTRPLATGPSIDEVIGAHVGASLPFRNLRMRVAVEGAGTLFSTSYAARFQPLGGYHDLRSAFQAVFTGRSLGGSDPDPEVSRRSRSRRRVVDHVLADLARVRQRVAGSDRDRLDEHLEAMHRLDAQLFFEGSARCSAPDAPDAFDLRNDATIPARASAAADIAVRAMACDLTRVAVIQFGRAGSTHRFPFLGGDFDDVPGAPAGLHGWAHTVSSSSSRRKLIEANRWYASFVAGVLDRLAEIPEGAASMLDNTVVAWINELSDGDRHLTGPGVPWVLAGNVAGFFRTGRLISPATSFAHNHLLVALLHAFGIDRDEFNDPDYRGPLADLSA